MTSDQREILALRVGDADMAPEIRDGFLHSLGAVTVNGTPLRNPCNRFLPWFDAYTGEVFRRFRWLGVETRGEATVLRTRAESDPDYPFMERRDSSGDVVLRSRVWDAAPVTADFAIVLEPAAATIDGRAFAGVRYWFEYDGATPIHRLLDRQTWEIGGNLDDVTVICRNLFDLPKKHIARDDGFSTVGLENWHGALPGNLWARWSMLPPFDMQAGAAGVFAGWFDAVSCIRTVVESLPGEEWIRYLDLHYFEQNTRVRTNPKTILHCPDVLDDVAMLNCWTRLHDREQEKAQRQFAIRAEQPPATMLGANLWQGIDFATAYEPAVALAAEFGIDYVFIDSVFENGETYRAELEALLPPERQQGTVLEKVRHGHMCLTLDFAVSRPSGGVDGLRNLCARAAARGVKIMSWMSTHYWPRSTLLQNTALGHGDFGVIAAKESGHHPDTGYAGDCWTMNLNAPIREHLRAQLLDACRQTGLAGFLWDSFSNLGWWQVDYSAGTLRPQFDRMLELYRDLTNAGLYLQPEALVSFTAHSGCGPFGVDLYPGELLGYAYNTVIGLHFPTEPGGPSADQAAAILRGRAPLTLLFRCFAHRRIPPVDFLHVPREEWDPCAAAAIKDLFAVYRATRHLMQRRTVLPHGAGVRWDNAEATPLLYSFHSQPAPPGAIDAATGTAVTDGILRENRVYRV